MKGCDFRAVITGAQMVCCLPSEHDGKHRLTMRVRRCAHPGCPNERKRRGLCMKHYRKALAAGRVPEPVRPTKGKVAPDWEIELAMWRTSLVGRQLSPRSIDTRMYHIRRLARWAGTRAPYDVTVGDLQQFMGEHTWKIETARSVRSSLTTFYGWAFVAERTTTDPGRKLPSIRPGQPRPHPASEDAYETALANADTRERVMLRLAGECGMRRAEVAQVHRRDMIEESDGLSLLVHGKGDKERTIPVPASVAVEVHALMSKSPNGYLFPPDAPPFGGVYPSEHISPHWMGTLVTRLLPPGVTMHALRHRFATRAYNTTKDLFATQTLLGHASADMTRRYVAQDRSGLRSIVEGIAS